jgi:hypothetical protein
MEQTLVETTRQLTNKEMCALLLSLQERVTTLEAALQSKSSAQVTSKEMTDEDARSVLNGVHATSKHKDAAAALGLTYGQVYSCRLEYTFKHIHKELKDAGFKNSWVK